jgi:serine/threonine-protein kinase
VPGEDLAAVLRANGPLPEARAAEIGQQVLGALAEAHETGIVHRDMKPGNVMVTRTRTGEDFVKVLDFGIAKLRDEGGASTTSAGAIVGTPNYLAPEQARGDAPDARSDLYALGCVLYELAAGRPPFVAPNPMAVVSAHLTQEPPPLLSLAPGVSRRYAEIVHRALRKKPADRFASADDMRDALLAVTEPTGSRPLHPAAPEVTGGLEIARREDFRSLERQVQTLRGSRVAPLVALLLAAASGGLVWRWPDVHALLVERAPELAARIPPALRPSGVVDGVEQEPNDLPGRANPLVLPPGADGSPAGGSAVVSGHVGAKLDAHTGDVDLYRIDVPPLAGPKLLVAQWRGDAPGPGIRGLDVVLGLNRAPSPGSGGAAPLVHAVNRGGPGAPETLAALVAPGRYFLAVREQHEEATGPVEKPTDAYVLSVSLADPPAGVAVEPDDAPERSVDVPNRYPAWLATAERNTLRLGGALAGDAGGDDPDTLALAAAEAPGLLVVVPEPTLALEARLWTPDAEDLAPGGEERVRFEPAADARPGAVIVVKVAAAAAPPLVQLRALDGAGGYRALLASADDTSGAAVLDLVRSLADAGRAAAALELAAAYAVELPRGAARAEVLAAAWSLAERTAVALPPEEVHAFDRAAQRLGEAVFELAEGKVRYRAAFEARLDGDGRRAEEAALRRARLANPCAPVEVAVRAGAFLERRPAPAEDLAFEALRLRARALEEIFWAAGGADVPLREAAIASWRRAAEAGGPHAAEASARSAALAASPAARDPAATPVCP